VAGAGLLALAALALLGAGSCRFCCCADGFLIDSGNGLGDEANAS
jgi:hypothetical protein